MYESFAQQNRALVLLCMRAQKPGVKFLDYQVQVSIEYCYGIMPPETTNIPNRCSNPLAPTAQILPCLGLLLQ